MHVFRVMMKDKNPQGGNNYVDLAAQPSMSLVAFAQAIKIQGGVCNEAVAIPYENILFVQRLEMPAPEGVIDMPTMGTA